MNYFNFSLSIKKKSIIFVLLLIIKLKTMAFINKEKTKVIRNEIKKQFPRKDGWKFSVVNENHSSIHVSIMEAPVRFHEKDYAQLNHYYPENYENSEILSKIKDIANGYFLNEGEKNYNRSDLMTDYFDVGWYVNISQGKWDKPFKQIKK